MHGGRKAVLLALAGISVYLSNKTNLCSAKRKLTNTEMAEAMAALMNRTTQKTKNRGYEKRKQETEQDRTE